MGLVHVKNAMAVCSQLAVCTWHSGPARAGKGTAGAYIRTATIYALLYTYCYTVGTEVLCVLSCYQCALLRVPCVLCVCASAGWRRL